jgi:hypothetical protein
MKRGSYQRFSAGWISISVTICCPSTSSIEKSSVRLDKQSFGGAANIAKLPELLRKSCDPEFAQW